MYEKKRKPGRPRKHKPSDAATPIRHQSDRKQNDWDDLLPNPMSTINSNIDGLITKPLMEPTFVEEVPPDKKMRLKVRAKVPVNVITMGDGKKPATSIRSKETVWCETQMLVNCPNHVIEMTGAELFGVSTMTVRQWIKDIYSRWKESTKAHERYDQEKIRNSLEQVYQRAMDSGDLRAATACADRIARLLGLYYKTQADAEDAGPQAFRSPESVRDRIDALMKNPEMAQKLKDTLGKAED